MSKQILAVGLSKLEYAPIKSNGERGVTFEEINVIHEDTFTYENDDSEEVKYNNELTGQPYFIDRKPGDIRINFSLGMYDLETKTKFMGGTYAAGAADSPGSWKRGNGVPSIEYTFRATTKDGVVITIPRGSVSAKGAANEKAIGLALVITAMQPTKKEEVIEEWFDGIK